MGDVCLSKSFGWRAIYYFRHLRGGDTPHEIAFMKHPFLAS
jgi:hypothetical protein